MGQEVKGRRERRKCRGRPLTQISGSALPSFVYNTPTSPTSISAYVPAERSTDIEVGKLRDWQNCARKSGFSSWILSDVTMFCFFSTTYL